MPKSFLFSLLFITVGSSAALAQNEKLERLMDYYAAHDNFNGTALVVKKGAVLLAKGYGYRDARNKIKNTENTIYELGSNTDLFTAEMIIQLDSKGKLGLDDKLAKYLPDYPYGDRISLKNLLTQSSGIGCYTKEPLFSGDQAHFWHPMYRDEITDRFKNQPLAFAPGAEVRYSNANFFLLGTVIEKITRKKYDRELRDDILINCGMTHTGFDYAHLRDENRAIGYDCTETEKFAEAPATDSLIAYAVGEIYTTAGDLLKWHRALMHHKLLPKDWQDLAYAPCKNQYAPGCEISNSYNRKFMQHAGATGGFSNYVVRQEEDDVLIVLLENVVRHGETDSVIAGNIIHCLYDRNYVLPWERKQPAVFASAAAPAKEQKKKPAEAGRYKKYVGEFEITPAFSLSFTTQDNELYASSPDEKDIKMIPEGGNLFRASGWNAEIEFVAGNGGAVNKIVLHQQGQLIPGVRSK